MIQYCNKSTKKKTLVIYSVGLKDTRLEDEITDDTNNKVKYCQGQPFVRASL